VDEGCKESSLTVTQGLESLSLKQLGEEIRHEEQNPKVIKDKEKKRVIIR
jgi:hypothetical protein